MQPTNPANTPEELEESLNKLHEQVKSISRVNKSMKSFLEKGKQITDKDIEDLIEILSEEQEKI